jgi:para-nitrobenzyl esterase
MYRYFNADASAEQMAARFTAPIYLCDINHGNEDSESPNPVSGAFHGVFLPLLSGEHRKAGNAPEGFWEETSYLELASMFQQYLKNFVSTGNPNEMWTDVWQNCTQNVLSLQQWNQWNKETKLSLVLDVKKAADTDHKKALAENRKYQDSYSAIIDDMKKDASVSEKLKDKIVRHVLNGRWFSAELDKNW